MSYVDRMIEERNELETKITALNNFIRENDTFSYAEKDEQMRMIQQLGFMTSYHNILEFRILNAGKGQA